MMKKSVFLGLCLLVSASAFTCELPQNEVIQIGCSSNCDFFYRFRVTMTAWMMGYKTSFTDLSRKTDMKKAMSEVDAILIPGGADIDPKYYLEEVSPELRDYTKKNLHLVKYSDEGKERDPYEYNLIKTYSEDETFKDLPMLGICRGLQIMSVAQGIPLYLDIKTELGIKNRERKFDRIRPTDDSLISSIYRPESFLGFKLHHQGLRVPYYEENHAKYPRTRVTAYSNDRKIAEAIEYTHRPALGVQYHPEKSFSATSVPVFKWFLNKACEYKTSKESK
jgi:putative glutamine amidotransferase